VNTISGRIFAMIRILVGLCFIWIGVSILTDEDLLFGGLLRRLNDTGGPVRVYRSVVLPFIERHETSLTHAVGIGNIVVGLFYVTGTLISLTSLAAAFLVANYGLASSSTNRPRMAIFALVTLLLLMLGRAAPGLTWGVDGWLIRRFHDWLVLFPLRRKAPQ
jgi:uncharacterized membrane protein YphA (DoxX/SURF4 family)